jgi:ABC-type lipopolysaccharide export system ATPase subunit
MSKLHVDSVLKSYGSNQILTNIYLSCEKGDIVGLFGRNGSGKSTLLKIIFGSITAENKFVKIGDKIINGLADNRHLLNYLPQNHFLPNHIKTDTIIDLFCDNENAIKIKKHNLIIPMLNKKSKQLSGGERRLLEIWLIVYSNTKYTLIDEPFNGVAPVYKEEIKRIIKEQSKFKGFIITDHDYRNILDIVTRKFVIHDGATKEFKDNNDLKYWGYLN